MYSQFYISTGEQTKMYTLRHQFEEKVFFKGEGGQPTSAIVMRDYYIRNLSSDATKAVEVALSLGYQVSKPQFTLDEIKRRTEEEMAQARKEAKQAADEREQAFLRTQKEKQERELANIRQGKFPFGRNAGIAIDDMVKDRGDSWVEYWILQGREMDDVVHALGAYLEANYPRIAKYTLMDQSGNGLYLGQPKDKMTNVKAMKVKEINFDSYYGVTFIEKFIAESGELLVYMGGKPSNCEKGELVSLNFTVKSHEVYEGDNQTKIIRVKVKPLEEEAR